MYQNGQVLWSNPVKPCYWKSNWFVSKLVLTLNFCASFLKADTFLACHSTKQGRLPFPFWMKPLAHCMKQRYPNLNETRVIPYPPTPVRWIRGVNLCTSSAVCMKAWSLETCTAETSFHLKKKNNETYTWFDPPNGTISSIAAASCFLWLVEAGTSRCFSQLSVSDVWLLYSPSSVQNCDLETTTFT